MFNIVNKLKNILQNSNTNSPVTSTHENNNTTSNTNQISFNMKLYSGATKHFFRKDHLRFLSDIKILQNGPIATLPNGHIVKATHEGNHE